jgi:hypothetical protein
MVVNIFKISSLTFVIYTVAARSTHVDNGWVATEKGL